MEGVSFTLDDTAEETGVTFENKPVIATEEAKVRAEQAQVAFGNSVRLDPQEMQNVIEFDGTDNSYREILQQIETDAMSSEKESLLNETLQQKDDIGFASASQIDPSTLARPTETNIEEAYASNMLDVGEAVVNEELPPTSAVPALREWAENNVFDVAISKQAMARIEKQDTGNPLGDIADFAQVVIPFRQGAILSNEVEGETGGKFLEGTGANMLKQIAYIKGIEDKAERKRVFNETVDKIAESSLDSAYEFARNYSEITDESANYITLFTEGMDLLDVATLGGVSAVKGLAGLSKGLVKGIAKKNPVKGIAEETVDSAGSVAVSLSRKGDTTKTAAEVEAGELYDTYFTVFNPERIFTGDTNLAAGAQQMIREHLKHGTDEVSEKLRSANFGVDRVSPLELKYAVEATQAQIRQDYRGLRFVNVSDTSKLNPATNTYSIAMDIGKKDGSLWASEAAAKNYASKFVKLKTDDYEIFEQGGKWGIRIEKDIDEFAGFRKAMQEGAIETTETFNDSLPNLFLGRLRESSSVESKGAFDTKLASLHGAQDMYKTFQVVSKPYFDLMKRKEDYAELGKVFNYLRETVDTKTGKVGRWAEDAGDFENLFFWINNKMPTPEQHLAYWSYRQASDIEKVLADTSRHATYLRLGAQKVSTSGKMGKNKIDISGNMRILDRERETVDLGGKDDFFKMAIIDKDGNIKVTSNKGQLDDLNQALSNNWEIAKAVEGGGVKVGKQRVHYILSEAGLKKDRLKMSDTGTGYTGGGHLMNEHPFYVKIANISDDVYTGDDVLVNAFSLQQARDIAEDFNKAKKMFWAGDDSWRTFARDRLPFMEPDDLEKFLQVRRGDVDAVGLRAGQKYSDAGNLPKNVLKYDNSKFDEIGDYERRFAEERTNPDLKVMREETKGKYTVETAPKLDAGAALQKGMNVAVTARMQKDSLVRGVSGWVKQFDKVLNKEKWTPEKIWQDPMGFLNDDDVYLSAISEVAKWKAETARQAMLRQIDYGTATGRVVDMLGERIQEIMHGRGQTRLIPLHRLPSIKDPLVFSRALAYNAYLGLFNIQQIAVQGIGTLHLAAVAPQYYTRGVAAAMALRSATYTSRRNILSHFGKNFSKHTGLSADEFAQMATDMRTSGWSEMGGSMAQIADDVTGALMQGKVDKFLDWGRVIPTSIDRFHRLAAWSVAWMETKAAKKGATNFSRQELTDILRRANVLSGNMSSANNAAWQRGALAPATQFMTYPLRIMEQVLPGLAGRGDLTRAEALRVVGTQSFIFGLPMGGAGAAFSLWSFDDTIREQAYKQWGVEIDDSYAEWLMDGVPSTMLEWITSSEGLKDGIDIDVSRLALGQESIFQRAISGDLSIGEFFAGPAGAFITGAAKAGIVDPVWNAYVGATSTDDYDYYPIAMDDFAEAARQISTIDVAFKSRDALFRGVWTSRTGKDETEVGFGEAMLNLVTGGTPQDVTLSRLRRGIMYEDKQRDTAARKIVVDLYAKGLKAGQDSASRRSFFGQAKAVATYYNLDSMTLHRLMVQAGKQTGMRADAIEELFYKDGIKRGRIDTGVKLGDNK